MPVLLDVCTQYNCFIPLSVMLLCGTYNIDTMMMMNHQSTKSVTVQQGLYCVIYLTKSSILVHEHSGLWYEMAM